MNSDEHRLISHKKGDFDDIVGSEENMVRKYSQEDFFFLKFIVETLLMTDMWTKLKAKPHSNQSFNKNNTQY